MPFIAQTAVGKREFLSVFGDDTLDGTGVRDYIHVVDLAHVKAIDYLNSQTINSKPLITNIGTGSGSSVLEMKKQVIQNRRANPSYAKEVLGWEARWNVWR